MARKTIKNENPSRYDMCNANYRDRISVIHRVDEKWLPVKLDILQDWYYVSNYGRIYSRFTDLLISPRYIGRGYLTVTLRTKDNKPIDILVHRLVMMTFDPIDNPENYQVNHIDCIKTNNTFNNLEWVTQSENMTHAYNNGLRKPGEYNNFCITNEDTVIKICELLETKKYTTKQIAEIVGLTGHEALISQIRVRNNWKHVSKHYNF